MLRFLFVACLTAAMFMRPAAAAPADDVAAVQKVWAAAFTALDPAAIAALYSDDALMFGAPMPLRAGRDGVKAYFEAIPKGVFTGVEFNTEKAVALTPDVISMAGSATFKRGSNSDLVFRITWVLVKRDGKWLIASHHVSPKTG